MTSERSLADAVAWLEREVDRLRVENRELHAEVAASIGAPASQPEWVEVRRLRDMLISVGVDPDSGRRLDPSGVE